MKKNLQGSKIDSSHSDFEVLSNLKVKIEDSVGGAEKLQSTLPELFRKALDEVIDTPRTGRRLTSNLEKTEKTYIGTKVEILIRNFLGFPKGHLDLKIDGLDVDIKNTLGNNWMIPTEAIGKPCILIACDEDRFLCFVGIFVAHLSNLSASTNKDGKRSLSSEGFENILWLLNGVPYPANFWASVDENNAAQILDMKASGTERLRRLFTLLPKKSIPRNIIESVARQKDYMKRLRVNGGARDNLAKEGFALLSGTYDKALIKKLNLPPCAPDEFISVKAESAAIAKLLTEHGHAIKWPTE